MGRLFPTSAAGSALCLSSATRDVFFNNLWMIIHLPRLDSAPGHRVIGYDDSESVSRDQFVPSFLAKSSRTIFGLALPPEACITCPMRKPMALF